MRNGKKRMAVKCPPSLYACPSTMWLQCSAHEKWSLLLYPLILGLATWLALDNRASANVTQAEAWKVLTYIEVCPLLLLGPDETTMGSSPDHPSGEWDLSYSSCHPRYVNEAILDHLALVKLTQTKRLTQPTHWIMGNNKSFLKSHEVWGDLLCNEN